ncbi:MAG: threonine-phosphate decarboxylase CobD [Jhaorihella sp.]
MRDHGGDLDRAKQVYGEGNWHDLSTGINARPYPVERLPGHAWTTLPTRSDLATLEAAATQQYATRGHCVALGGAQAAIQLVPRLRRSGRACVVGPTYNEHAAALRAQGWQVTMVSDPEQAAGADLLTVVNPNNPDGRRWSPEALLALRAQVGLFIVDESFADTEAGLSVAPFVDEAETRMVVLRSFGKFFGLAGVRLGFALTGSALAGQLRALAGPWAVSGPAIAIGTRALADADWHMQTRERLRRDAQRLDALARRAGWGLVGGTPLFRTYVTPHAKAAQEHLARHHVWSRIFPYSETWLRLGLPGNSEGWAVLETALDA